MARRTRNLRGKKTSTKGIAYNAGYHPGMATAAGAPRGSGAGTGQQMRGMNADMGPMADGPQGPTCPINGSAGSGIPGFKARGV